MTELAATSLVAGALALTADGTGFIVRGHFASAEGGAFSVMQVMSDGSFGWAGSYGVWPLVHPRDIAVGPDDRIHVVGTYEEGELTIGTQTLSAGEGGTKDGFVASFAP